ncbi:MAG: prepilin-type N-terminal cleavage/methylation domain-containing protein, partial [Verrucomicrobiae bacterium]|nr:prepilin-type N-terminal cleavage/methylation domain-containing protein [Verrucomicrobiae bacterium]
MDMVGAKRKGFALVEAIVAMLVLSIALFAAIEVFIFSLRITALSALHS